MKDIELIKVLCLFLCMKIIIYISEFMIPLVAVYIIGVGIVKKIPVYDTFIEGAKEGLKTVLDIIPTLIGLMIGVKVISASGFLLWMAKGIGYFTEHIGVPANVIPVIIVRFFSSNAANGLCLDIFKNMGPDSYEGFFVSILMSCTETIFYTLSVYSAAAKVRKTGWTLPGAFISTLAGVVASAVLAVLKMK